MQDSITCDSSPRAKPVRLYDNCQSNISSRGTYNARGNYNGRGAYNARGNYNGRGNKINIFGTKRYTPTNSVNTVSGNVSGNSESVSESNSDNISDGNSNDNSESNSDGNSNDNSESNSDGNSESKKYTQRCFSKIKKSEKRFINSRFFKRFYYSSFINFTENSGYSLEERINDYPGFSEKTIRHFILKFYDVENLKTQKHGIINKLMQVTNDVVEMYVNPLRAKIQSMSQKIKMLEKQNKQVMRCMNRYQKETIFEMKPARISKIRKNALTTYTKIENHRMCPELYIIRPEACEFMGMNKSCITTKQELTKAIYDYIINEKLFDRCTWIIKSDDKLELVLAKSILDSQNNSETCPRLNNLKKFLEWNYVRKIDVITKQKNTSNPGTIDNIGNPGTNDNIGNPGTIDNPGNTDIVMKINTLYSQDTHEKFLDNMEIIVKYITSTINDNVNTLNHDRINVIINAFYDKYKTHNPHIDKSQVHFTLPVNPWEYIVISEIPSHEPKSKKRIKCTVRFTPKNKITPETITALRLLSYKCQFLSDDILNLIVTMIN